MGAEVDLPLALLKEQVYGDVAAMSELADNQKNAMGWQCKTMTLRPWKCTQLQTNTGN